MAQDSSVVTRDSDKEAAEVSTKLESVRTDLRIAEDVDPLEAILAIDKAPDQITDTFPVPIVGGKTVPWTVRALTGEQIDEIDELCTTWVKRGRGDRQRQRDTQRFERMLVAAATVKPDLEDARVTSKFGGRSPDERVGKILMPGTYDGLSSRILELSGYTDDLIGTAGN